jgi:hypothetical protein
MTDDKPTPSMDDKDIPSPPVRTNEQYIRDSNNGVQRVGQPSYRGGQK